MTLADVKTGLTFRMPGVQVRGWGDVEWVSPIYRVNRVTGNGVVYYGIVGQPKSGWKMSTLSFLRDFESGRKVLTPAE